MARLVVKLARRGRVETRYVEISDDEAGQPCALERATAAATASLTPPKKRTANRPGIVKAPRGGTVTREGDTDADG